ncbi:wall-associated receptor kinase-like 8 [Olea europaea var. sylvestris]|uniref:wall-associated receptor kinase-like 8 n=1 Tax=Olea europaea var. sylvestris TaxID=158386 RepID=UPI000C1CD6AD|nr:wall-associated receptor kinase-like 8 [Olea europaea var. sylvestris]
MQMHSVLLQIFCFLSLVVALPPNAVGAATTKPGCQSRCGNLEIPYPFGIGSKCSRNVHFNINCNTSFDPPKPYLPDRSESYYYEVVNISETQIFLKNSEAQLAMACYGMGFNNKTENSTISITFLDSPYTLSDTNQITSIGCDDMAMASQLSYLTNTFDGSVCASYCGGTPYYVHNGSCPGRGCCRTSISRVEYLRVELLDMHSYWGRERKHFRCSFAFVGVTGDYDKFNFSLSHLDNSTTFLRSNEEFTGMPLVLDWRIGDYNCIEEQNSTNYACGKNSYCINYDTSLNFGGYHCKCKEGFEGNPYLGCHDIDECINNRCVSYGTCTNTPGSYNCSCPDGYYGDGKRDGIGCIPILVSHSKLAIGIGLGAGVGFLLLLSTCFCLFKFHQKRKIKKRKEKFFKQNGGILLQQQTSTDECILEKTQLFTIKELEKATDNFNESRILGQGGQGTVYKGMLHDGKIIAIKKSKLVNTNQVEQFINEVVMLSQVIHRNVVKLLGCCLETEVPLLVYEFICNGTLFDHIHDKSSDFPLSWNMRLKIAIEVAEALAYLHSATSFPIYHRDIKSTNILLDEKYVAKVSDFGTSRLIAMDHTHVTTQVKGTFGYVDPEYFQSNQFTEKSDVYSYGVVLVELLTGQRPTSLATQEEKSLATRFLLCMDAENLETIVDAQVLEQSKREELFAVAKLAQRCLNLNGKKRPTMKEIAMELEIVRMSQTHSTISETKYQDIQLCKSKTRLMADDNYTWTSNYDNIIPSSDAYPLEIHTV